MDAIVPQTEHKGKTRKGGNGGVTEHEGVVELSSPFVAEVSIEGTEPILLHRYDCESVAAKGAARKGSKEKKSDNLESYVYRNEKNQIVIPGINFKACLCETAKFSQDPRSPRKSARDLFRAGIKVVNDASFGHVNWEYVDKRKVSVQRNAVTRQRPAFGPGWELTYQINVLLPEYIDKNWLQEIVTRAGRVTGLGDFRPDFGLFNVNQFKVIVGNGRRP
jgi:hypothetical protein